jgi:hypothetical protein
MPNWCGLDYGLQPLTFSFFLVYFYSLSLWRDDPEKFQVGACQWHNGFNVGHQFMHQIAHAPGYCRITYFGKELGLATM